MPADVGALDRIHSDANAFAWKSACDKGDETAYAADALSILEQIVEYERLGGDGFSGATRAAGRQGCGAGRRLRR